VHIALVSTPFVAVPPPRYGGTELVVADLALGLRAAGHEVTLFATGDSELPGCRIEALEPTPVWPPEPFAELSHAAWAIGRIILRAEEYDVIHAHVPSALAMAEFVGLPMVYTLHHEYDEALLRYYERRRGLFTPIAISRRQSQFLLGCDDCEVVHHGLDVSRYPFGAGGDDVAFLGRLAAEKGPHLAIDAARLAGRRIRLGGKPHWNDHEYCEQEIERRAAVGEDVELLGELGHDAKCELLSSSAATLCPLQWEEPFGLVMIESMLCGTPVVAFARGAAPELIDPGVTGFLARDPHDMARLLREEIPRFDRRACRARATLRFNRERMVRDYLTIYQRLAHRVSRAEEHVVFSQP
jgi:glycosyltransferase involved in cell wall biosynthesis